MQNQSGRAAAQIAITVSPTTAQLCKGGWGSKTIVTVYNKSDAVQYDVWLRVSLEVIGMPPEKVTIRDITVPQRLVGQVMKLEVAGDAVGFLGEDQVGPAILFLLHRIEPRSTITFGIDVHPAAVRRPSAAAAATFEILSHSAEPEGQFLQGDNKIARGFKFPIEGFSIRRHRST